MPFDGAVFSGDGAAIRQFQNHRFAIRLDVVQKADIVRQAALDRAVRLETAMRHRDILMVIRFAFRWKDLRCDADARLRRRERRVANRHVPHAAGFKPEGAVACQQNRQADFAVFYQNPPR